VVVRNPNPSLRPEQRPSIDPGALSMVDQCLEAALRSRASDIHIEPQTDRLTIRMRIDGRLELWRELPGDLHLQFISRLKVMASLDISEKRMPQDGRFSIETTQGPRDFRISVVPMLAGEKAVVRVLMQDLSKLDFRSVGYSERNLRVYEELLGKPHGLLLHCGPTGSGKTTALYAAINHLRQVWRNIQTVEDPVEGRLPGVNQAQVNAEIGLTFARLLRGYLRQDCDVILIGEIRDPETAQLALQASLTGHLVLGTLHTNSAAGAVARLIDMGVPHFFVGTGLVGVVSQRLVRRLCPHCRRRYAASPELTKQYGLPQGQALFDAAGCQDCGNTGYRGRIGIQEVLPAAGKVREAIFANASEQELQKLALQTGMTSIFHDGLGKAMAGLTTIEEVYRAVVSDTL
jgi:type II secretory ATPase GspE/PulE/Tfp pilus assembly ATPase PilB-like protein